MGLDAHRHQVHQFALRLAHQLQVYLGGDLLAVDGKEVPVSLPRMEKCRVSDIHGGAVNPLRVIRALCSSGGRQARQTRP